MTVGDDVAVNGSGPLPELVVANAVRLVVAGEGKPASVSVTFVDPRSMAAMNSRYKDHEGPTDVISFPLPQPDGTVAGDIYICPWYAAREARERGEPVRRELLRLVIHGTLHVLGHEHPEDGDREESVMWQLQERYLEEIG